MKCDTKENLLVFVFGVGALCLLGFIPVTAIAEATLIFKTGFESNTNIERSGGTEIITGTDESTGYDWNALKNRFNDVRFQYVSGSDFDPYVDSEIRTLKGPSGVQTKALYLNVNGDNPDKSGRTRNELQFFPQQSDEQLYARFWIKSDADFIQNAPSGNWYFMVTEVKEPGNPIYSCCGSNQWRMNVHIFGNEDEDPYWHFNTQQVQPTKTTEHSEVNKDVAVPIGEWFYIEIFWKYHATNGRFHFSVNGRKVFDYHGRTQHRSTPLGVQFFSPFKNYGKEAFMDGPKSIHFIYDDLEIWTDFPPDAGVVPVVDDRSVPLVPEGVRVVSE